VISSVISSNTPSKVLNRLAFLMSPPLRPQQGNITSNNNSSGNGSNNFTEYKLKMSPMAVSHNVMVLNSTTAKLSDFAQPVRMFRDKNSALIQEVPLNLAGGGVEGPSRIAVGGGSIAAPGSRASFKKKTKIFYQGDEEEFDERTREAESAPWLLEDYDAQHSFVGRLEGGQNSNYVFFVNQGDEFRIIPVNKWYRFQSKLSYHTLSLEEAEVQMAARKKDDVSRWLMKNRSGNGGGGEEEEKDASSATNKNKMARLAEKVLSGESAQRRKQSQIVRSRIEDAQKGDELDFDELFDDDEGNDNFGGLLDDVQLDEATASTTDQQTGKKANYKLSGEGRAVKKIVRHLDKTNDIIYASDEENDPYASDFENNDDEDGDDFDKWTTSNATNKEPIVKGPKPTTTATSTTTTNASVGKPSNSNSKVASLSVSPVASKTSSAPGSPNRRGKRSKTADEDDSLISEAELLSHLRQGPISTKDLIAKFKRQLKADPKNKEIFRELVRKLAMVKTAAGASGEEDKLLELKPEFKQ
jgi:transcription initiation factor TFIIF subunit alpha